jgi:hypothetical protein
MDEVDTCKALALALREQLNQSLTSRLQEVLTHALSG